MNELINGNAIKMTSIEIAELVESRHSNVKVSIDRLVKRGVIKPPALQHTNIINDLGVITGKRYFYVFEGEQGKRDSIIVVAQLSPEFTARLVDRWRELEEAAVNIPKTLAESNRGGCLMANLRKEARGRECQVRIYGICNGNPETTVLAHYRMAGICGTGMKPEDLIGAWACSACHDEIDRRTHNLDNKDARLYHLEGVIRTQAILLKEGKIKP